MPTLRVLDRQGEELAREPSGPDAKGEALIAYSCLALRPVTLSVVNDGKAMPTQIGALLRAALVKARESTPAREAWTIEALDDEGASVVRYDLIDVPPSPDAVAYETLRSKVAEAVAGLQRPVFACEVCIDFLKIADSDVNVRRVAYALTSLGWHVGSRRGSGFRAPPWWPPGSSPRLVGGPHPISWKGSGEHPFFARHPERRAG